MPDMQINPPLHYNKPMGCHIAKVMSVSLKIFYYTCILLLIRYAIAGQPLPLIVPWFMQKLGFDPAQTCFSQVYNYSTSYQFHIVHTW